MEMYKNKEYYTTAYSPQKPMTNKEFSRIRPYKPSQAIRDIKPPKPYVRKPQTDFSVPEYNKGKDYTFKEYVPRWVTAQERQPRPRRPPKPNPKPKNKVEPVPPPKGDKNEQAEQKRQIQFAPLPTGPWGNIPATASIVRTMNLFGV